MAFDTHASVKKLQEAGFTAQQAEAQVELLLTIVEGNLATKQDLKETEGRTEIRLKELDAKIELVRRDLKEMESRTEIRLKEMESRTEIRLKELDAKIELVRRDLKEMESRSDHKFELVHQKIELARRDTIIWLGGIVVAGFAVMAAMTGVVIAFVAL